MPRASIPVRCRKKPPKRRKVFSDLVSKAAPQAPLFVFVVPALSRDRQPAAVVTQDSSHLAKPKGRGVWVPAHGRDDTESIDRERRLEGGHGATAPFPTLRISRFYHPSSTILPRDLPLSSSACARFKFAALMVPKVWSSVVRSTPLSMRSATSLSSMCWPIMSGVWNEERVNIDSQWIETALPLNAATLNSGGSSIRPNFPCGAMISAMLL